MVLQICSKIEDRWRGQGALLMTTKLGQRMILILRLIKVRLKSRDAEVLFHEGGEFVFNDLLKLKLWLLSRL